MNHCVSYSPIAANKLLSCAGSKTVFSLYVINPPAMNLQKHFQKTEFTFLFTITNRGLLDDTYFIQAVKKVVQEPIPYFRQFSDKLPTHGAINSPPISSTPRQPSDAAEPDQVGGNILGIH